MEEMPLDAMPPDDAPGNHSYSVKVLSNTGLQLSVDALLRHEAFYIKKPEQCKGQYSWKKWGSISECWAAWIHTADCDPTLRISAIELMCILIALPRDMVF